MWTHASRVASEFCYSRARSVLALLRHHEATSSGPLSRVKRSCRKHRLRSEFDPQATSGFLGTSRLRQSFEPDTRLSDDRDPAIVVYLDDPIEPVRRNLHQLAADSL